VVLTGDPTTDTGSRPSRPDRPSARRPAQESHRGPARRIAVIVLATALTLALIRSLLVQSFVVPTASMEPTVHPGDRVLVSRLAYRTGDIKRGDVIVFNGAGVFEPDVAPARSGLAAAGRAVAAAFSLPIGSQDYLKRVIGLPGDRVVCCDLQGRLSVNGTPLNEKYLHPGDEPSSVRFDVQVPPGRLWVLGDHRSDSADSRSHLGDPGGGTVPVGRVVGRVVGVYWPLSRAGGLATSAADDVTGAAGGAHPSIGKDQR
jgi:signal peptidase I